MKSSLLILADESARKDLEELAETPDLTVEIVHGASAMLERLRAGQWTATLLSLGLAEQGLVERVATLDAAGALLLSTPSSSLTVAILAERIGAIAVLPEPIEPAQIVRHLSALGSEGKQVPLPEGAGAGELVGESAPMTEVFSLIAKAAPSDSTVLITGESGTGKELVARALHTYSGRAAGPFIPVNCAAIPEHLLESELFGHEKGAFTGAVARRTGRFERADGGTIFLDEIGDMSVVLQAKVLRVLEDRAVERVGGESLRPVDVRVIAATNQELPIAIDDGRFREDLFYRLAVMEIHLPPLRARGGDVRTLALHFARHFAAAHGRPITAITEGALARLEEQRWAGNVRELRNVMDRAVLLTGGDVIRSSALRLGDATPRASALSEPSAPSGYPPSAALAHVEADHIRRVLDHSGGQIGRAADVLGIHRNTLARKIREYGLDGAEGRSSTDGG
jgi:two-component system response regulator HydG